MAVPIIPQLALSASTYGGNGVAFGSKVAYNNTTGSTFVVPLGNNMVVTGTSNVVEYTADGGGTYTTLIPASSGGQIFSDGVTVRIRNTATTSTATTVPILGGSV